MANKVVIDTEINTSEATSQIQDLTDRLNDLKYAKKQLEAQGLGLGFEKYDNIIKGIASAERELNSYKKDLVSTEQATERVAESSKKASKSILRIGNSAKSNSHHLKIGLKTIMKYVFGIRSMFVLLRKIRSAISDGFKNLAQFNDGVNPVNTALSNLQSALTQLKNSFATAFAPILTVVEPILTSFINSISTAVTYVGMFFASITGQTKFTKAVAVQQNFADSLDKTGKNAKKAKNQLASFYDLVVLNSKDDSAGSGVVTPNKMFEEVLIPDNIAKSWGEAGLKLQNKLNGLLEGINWKKVFAGAKDFGTNLADFLNNLISPKLFGNVGKTIANSLNTMLETNLAFANNFNFYNFGESVATGLNNFFKTFNFGKLAETINSFCEGIVDAMKGFFDTFSWKDIFRGLFDFVSSISFETVEFVFGVITLKGLSKYIFTNLLGSTIGASTAGNGLSMSKPLKLTLAVTLAYEIIGNAVDSLTDSATTAILESVDSDSKFARGWREWWREFDLGTINLFHSLGFYSDAEAEEIIKKDAIWASDKYADYLKKEYEKIVSEETTALSSFLNVLTNGLYNEIVTLPNIRKRQEELIDEIYNKEYAEETGRDVARIMVESMDGEMKSIMPQTAKDMSKATVDSLNKAYGITGSGSADMKSVGKTLSKGIGSGFDDGSGFVTDSVNKLKNLLKAPINGVIGLVEKMANGVIDGINLAIKSLNQFSITVPDWIPLIGGNDFGFNMSEIKHISIPRLASGTVVPRQSSEFLAMLGDNNRETEVVSPLSTMKQAFMEALAESNVGGSSNVTVVLDGDAKNLFRVVRKEATNYTSRTGNPAFI